MKKICILTSVHSVFDTRIFHKEAKTLASVGYDVTLIAQNDKEDTVDGIKIIPLPKPKNRWERFFKTDCLLYKKALMQKADIYHFHDPELLSWMVKLKKKTGAKVIYDIHENISGQILDKEWIPEILRKPVSKIYKWREKKLLPLVDWVLLAEDSYLKIYKNYKNVSIIRNYPLISNKLLKNEIRLQHNFPKLVYVGGISKTRGIFEMIGAIKILKQKFKSIQLKMAGPIEGKIKLRMNNLVKYYGLNENIVFYGKISHPEALQLISTADIGLSLLYPVPNYIESLPTKLFEYMTAGLPVIASNFPLWKKIIEGNNCGICVNPTVPKEIAKAIKYLIEHPQEAKKMGENGRRAVLEKYNWENEGKKLLKVYEELTKNK